MKINVILFTLFVSMAHLYASNVESAFFENYPSLRGSCVLFAPTSIEREKAFNRERINIIGSLYRNNMRLGGGMQLPDVNSVEDLDKTMSRRLRVDDEYIETFRKGVDNGGVLVFVTFVDDKSNSEFHGYIVVDSGIVVQEDGSQVVKDKKIDFSKHRISSKSGKSLDGDGNRRK